MLRIILGVFTGFIAWLIVWIGIEKVLSAAWPAFGTNQAAFQAVVENQGDPTGFAAGMHMLITHIVVGSLASIIAGALAALIAGENRRAPMAVGVLLLALGLLKAAMSWPYVPIWYHVLFTAMLLPMAIVGGRLRTKTST